MLHAWSHGHRVAASTPSAILVKILSMPGTGWGEATGLVRQGLAAERGRPHGARVALEGRGREGREPAGSGRTREAQGGPSCPTLSADSTEHQP